MSSKFLKNTPRKVPFEVPEGYFGKLHAQIMARAGQERTTDASLSRRTAGSGDLTFKTPSGYFESLPARISQRIYLDTGARGNQAAGNPFIHRRAGAYKIAAAACVTVLLGILGILQVARKHNTQEPVTSVMNFDQEVLIQEYLKTSDAKTENQPGELEIYLLNQVEEGMLIQEL